MSQKEEIKGRVKWWITDMAFKPPEVLTDWYFECMAEDIACLAVNEDTDSTIQRLDPPLRR